MPGARSPYVASARDGMVARSPAAIAHRGSGATSGGGVGSVQRWSMAGTSEEATKSLFAHPGSVAGKCCSSSWRKLGQRRSGPSRPRQGGRGTDGDAQWGDESGTMEVGGVLLNLGKTQNWAGSEAHRGFGVAENLHGGCAQPLWALVEVVARCSGNCHGV
jgi:hypothetical protein